MPSRSCVVLFALLAVTGCAPNRAPIEDKPVWDGPRPPSASRSGTAQKSTAKAPASTTSTPSTAATPGSTTKPGSGVPASMDAKRQATAKAEMASEPASPDIYVVKKGDTLYAVALDHGQAYKDVAAWNSIAEPYVIRVGQSLRVRPPPGWVDKSESEEVIAKSASPAAKIEGKPLEAPAPPPLKSGPKGMKLAYSEHAVAQLTQAPTKIPAGEPQLAAAEQPAASSSKPKSAAAPNSVAPGPPVPSNKADPGAALETTSPKPAAAASEVSAPKSSAPTTEATPPKPSGSAGPKSAATAGAEAFSAQNGWVWPAQGKLLHAFNSGVNPKGIAIAGEAGQAVVASAPGKVVYSGSGLRGYGKLVIIKHDASYLSVYAHNRELLVKEGERVTRGQKIAEMGSSDADRVELHFEIRRQGKPVDPLQYLPATTGG